MDGNWVILELLAILNWYKWLNLHRYTSIPWFFSLIFNQSKASERLCIFIYYDFSFVWSYQDLKEIGVILDWQDLDVEKHRDFVRPWEHATLIPGLGRQRQVELCDLTEKFCLEKTKRKNNFIKKMLSLKILNIVYQV